MKTPKHHWIMIAVVQLALNLVLPPSFDTFAQQKKSDAEPDTYPILIKVYSKDGKESLSGHCTAKDPDTGQQIYSPRDPSRVTDITCSMVDLRYRAPNERVKGTPLPATYEDFVKQAVKNDPKLAEEIKRNPKKAKEEWNKASEALCSTELLAKTQDNIKTQQMGPKKAAFYEKWFKACSTKDFKAAIDNMNSLDSHTCSINVETLTMDFKRIGKGNWLSNPGPQGLCNVVSTYELNDVSGAMPRTVKFTVVTIGGFVIGGEGGGLFSNEACKAIREDTKEPMIWSLTNLDEFEPPCDFIKHDYILAPNP